MGIEVYNCREYTVFVLSKAVNFTHLFTAENGKNKR